MGIGSSQPGVHIPRPLAAAAGPFEPVNCLIDPRLNQMSLADTEIPVEEFGITGAELDCALLSGYRLIHRTDIGLAPAEVGQSISKVAVERQHHFVFGNRLSISAL